MLGTTTEDAELKTPADGGARVVSWSKTGKPNEAQTKDRVRLTRPDGSTLIMGPIAAGHRLVVAMKRPDADFKARKLPIDHNCYVVRAWHHTENTG